MATHRKARTALLSAPGPRTAVGLTTAALATVTLLSETASATPATGQPKPSIAQVKAKVDALMHQAEVATEHYDGAKAQTDQQTTKVNRLLAQAARKTEQLNDSRRVLGQYAAAQYRQGGDLTTTRYLMSGDPQDLADNAHLTDVLGKRQKQAVEDFRVQQASATQQRIEAAKSLATLTTQQTRLKAAKSDVQTKLSAAQKLLNTLNAQEKKRLAELAAKQEQEARQKAAALAAQQAKQQASLQTKAPVNSSVADQAIAFARQQLGKPYVWGATGPDSFDCSGLTQAAYKAAGITLPRTTYDQVNVGTRVSESDLRPGDLIFFYADDSHVGLYIGNGEMIHAPHTGTVVKIAPITEMPFYAAVRPY